MKAAIDGTAHIGMASRDLKDSEKEELDSLAIAIDGIAVIAHPSNPIDNITIDNIKSIFIGEITKWSEIK